MDLKLLESFDLDFKIKRVVFALNKLNIVTHASCEGHLDHGMSYPWIMCKKEMQKNEIIEYEKIYTRIPELEKIIETKYGRPIHLSWFGKIHNDPLVDELCKLWKERNTRCKLDNYNFNECFKFIVDLLVEFYRTKGVANYKTVLSVSKLDDLLIRINPHLGEYINNTNDDLKAYQEEMDRFAEYLENIK